MKLYYSPGACSLSPHIALHESGLKFEHVVAPIRTHLLEDGTDYYGINPLGYVPLLELDDGTRLTEGPAIVQYIADQAPGKQPAPANGTVARAQLQVSVADPYLFTVTNWAPRVGVDISALASLAAFRERVAARPAVQAAMKEEGLIQDQPPATQPHHNLIQEI